ncbi:hypothetical protein ACFY1A_25575 [Streptomyces sp. NPDC001520]|uniref:hypothetical protein n=1 Tax=Streptomyces sp. NPDC001520 TaxID=3364581 RepID=UPI0036D01348
MDALSIAVAAILGGTGGVGLGRWLGRGHLRIDLVSIREERGAEGHVELDDDTVKLSTDFPWGDSLLKLSPYRLVEDVSAAASTLRDEAPKTLELVNSLELKISTAKTRIEKVAILEEISNSLIFEEISGRLRRRLLHLDVKEYDLEAESFIDISEEMHEGHPAIVLSFPGFKRVVSYPGAGAKMTLDKVRPLILAMQYFDHEVLAKCLESARDGLEKESLQADALNGKLSQALTPDRIAIEVVITNSGDRVVVVNSQGALVTRGASVKLDPLPLRIASIRDSNGGLGVSQGYLAIDPQSARRYVCISDSIADDSKLRHAYDSELLDCAVVLASRKRSGGNKKLKSPWAAFGAGLGDAMRDEITQLSRAVTG